MNANIFKVFRETDNKRSGSLRNLTHQESIFIYDDNTQNCQI